MGQHPNYLLLLLGYGGKTSYLPRRLNKGEEWQQDEHVNGMKRNVGEKMEGGGGIKLINI
jgi:hypothetical protein